MMYDVIIRVVLVSLTSLYFKLVDQPLVCLKPLKTDEDVGLFVKALYENGSIIDLYCEHNGYDIMGIIQDQLAPKDQLVNTTFKCNADDVAHTSYENLDDLKDIVDFEVEGEENVVITRNTTDDLWLNKLVGNETFTGQTDDATSNLGGRFNHEENDPEDDIVDPKFKAKPFVRYPSFDPSTPWDQCQPVLGMKFENPQHLKYMLANYGVANGYQLWFMQNDHSDTPDDVECSYKPATKKNGRISEIMKKKWNDKKEYEKKRLQKSVPCPFRNYTLGSLVTYRWIAHHYAREIIDNPSLTHIYMQNSIKDKFLLHVSLGQCKRAKICALYDHDRGLIKHYNKLWEYRQAVLESNPGSTCHLETEDRDDDGKITFKMMYICFKGIKQGWLDACMKVIGLDECFLTHSCKGQLLTDIGRDGNNQMYPIAWAVVVVENKDNWAWYGLTIMRIFVKNRGRSERIAMMKANKFKFDANETCDIDCERSKLSLTFEWRPPRCDVCKIFGHVRDQCPKKVVTPLIVSTSPMVTPTVEKTNDGFQTVGKKKKMKGKSKSNNGGQFAGPSVKQTVRYEPKATTNTPKKGATNKGNESIPSSLLKNWGNSLNKDNITSSNSFSNVEEEDEEEEVENVYDETTNLFTKTGGSSFTAAAG
ncbi:hypothetical protein Tco_0307717 [Tanacetum coccineum]